MYTVYYHLRDSLLIPEQQLLILLLAFVFNKKVYMMQFMHASSMLSAATRTQTRLARHEHPRAWSMFIGVAHYHICRARGHQL